MLSGGSAQLVPENISTGAVVERKSEDRRLRILLVERGSKHAQLGMYKGAVGYCDEFDT
jgi:hypothetical protein